ncbi:MAG TPA: sialidase family protein [Phycisphaerales bacterium]|nr:sialidase family protein [Phycisphaerales bacterium]
MLSPTARLAALALAAGAPLALAQTDPTPPGYILPGTQPPILEFVGDAPAPPHIVQSSPTAPGLSRGFGGVQVNVNANGLNILNDAANEPSIAIDPTAPNRMVVGWRQFDTINSNFREAGNAWTNDGGRTWHNRPALTNGVFRSDPVLDADSAGTFYYSSLQGNLLVDTFISSDGGQTWAGPIPAYGGDKQWIAIDRTGGIGEGNFYMSWSTAGGCCGSRIFTRSTDGGFTYMNPILLPQSPVWGSMTVGSDGTLYIVGMNFNDGNVYCLRSTNAQDPDQTPTFQSSIVNLGATFWIGGSCDPNPEGLWGQLWIGVDDSGGPNDGNVYVVASADPPGTDPLDVRCAVSTDGGVTFNASTRVNDDAQSSTHYQWFGTASVAPDGRIDVVWNDSRESNVCNLSRLYYSFSYDGGQTWSANEPMGPQFDSYVGWPRQNKIGDYYHMRSDLVGADLAYAATYNGEQDVYHLRIGGSDCNRNGVEDAVDLSSGASGDCNANGIPDECDIAAGVLLDADGDGVPDECEDCYADCTADGELNTMDVICYLNAWNAFDPSADCDGNGAIDTRDVLCFLNLWNAGC